MFDHSSRVRVTTNKLGENKIKVILTRVTMLSIYHAPFSTFSMFLPTLFDLFSLSPYKFNLVLFHINVLYKIKRSTNFVLDMIIFSFKKLKILFYLKMNITYISE